jgi:hypothetical protein
VIEATTTTASASFLCLIPQNTRPDFLRDPSGSGYAPRLENNIQAAINRMLSDACTKAFRDAGLIPPSELLNNGVVIGPATLLNDSSVANLQYMGITENGRKTANKVNNSMYNGGVTVRDHPKFDPDTVDGRPRIFLTNNGINDLQYNLIHEFMHAGGADAYPGYTFGIGDDLQFFNLKHVRVGNGTKGEGIFEWRKMGATEEDIQKACR